MWYVSQENNLIKTIDLPLTVMMLRDWDLLLGWSEHHRCDEARCYPSYSLQQLSLITDETSQTRPIQSYERLRPQTLLKSLRSSDTLDRENAIESNKIWRFASCSPWKRNLCCSLSVLSWGRKKEVAAHNNSTVWHLWNINVMLLMIRRWTHDELRILWSEQL